MKIVSPLNLFTSILMIYFTIRNLDSDFFLYKTPVILPVIFICFSGFFITSFISFFKGIVIRPKEHVHSILSGIVVVLIIEVVNLLVL